jgi:hypothetical protein
MSALWIHEQKTLTIYRTSDRKTVFLEPVDEKWLARLKPFMELEEMGAVWHEGEAKDGNPGWLIPLTQFPFLAPFMINFGNMVDDSVNDQVERKNKATTHYLTLEEFQLLILLGKSDTLLQPYDHKDSQIEDSTSLTYRDMAALVFQRITEQYGEGGDSMDEKVIFGESQWFERWRNILDEFQPDDSIADLKLRYLQARGDTFRNGDVVVMKQLEDKDESDADTIVYYTEEYPSGYVDGTLKPFIFDEYNYIVPPREFSFPEYSLNYWDRDHYDFTTYRYIHINFENKEVFGELEETPPKISRDMLDIFELSDLQYATLQVVYHKTKTMVYFFAETPPTLDQITKYINNYSVYLIMPNNFLVTVI